MFSSCNESEIMFVVVKYFQLNLENMLGPPLPPLALKKTGKLSAQYFIINSIHFLRVVVVVGILT